MVSKIFLFKETRRSDNGSDTMSGRCTSILEAFLSLSVIAMAQRDKGEHKQGKTAGFLWVSTSWWWALITVGRGMSQGPLLRNVMFACLLYGLKPRREKGPRNCAVRKERLKLWSEDFSWIVGSHILISFAACYFSPFLWLLAIVFR